MQSNDEIAKGFRKIQNNEVVATSPDYEKDKKLRDEFLKKGWIEFTYPYVVKGRDFLFPDVETKDIFLFHPSLEEDISFWEQRGICSFRATEEKEDEFKSWLEDIPEDKYIEIF